MPTYSITELIFKPHQIKLTELKRWFQIEMTTIMKESMAPGIFYLETRWPCRPIRVPLLLWPY